MPRTDARKLGRARQRERAAIRQANGIPPGEPIPPGDNYVCPGCGAPIKITPNGRIHHTTGPRCEPKQWR